MPTYAVTQVKYTQYFPFFSGNLLPYQIFQGIANDIRYSNSEFYKSPANSFVGNLQFTDSLHTCRLLIFSGF